MRRMTDAEVTQAIADLRQDADELETEAAVYLTRSPQDRVRAERTADLERRIADHLEAEIEEREGER